MNKTKSQRERFEETARELKCDEDEDRFNATLKRVLKGGKSSQKCETQSDKNHEGQKV